jgi:adenosylcobinamide-GDP ribazoletransferase
LIGALAFLTIVGRGRRPDANQQLWFPVVGALVGALVGLVWWGAAQWWPPAVAAALAVATDLVLTGLLHVDGLADSADGLLPHMTRERRLQVMSQPDTGAFAVAVVALVLSLRWAGLASLDLRGARVVASTAGLWALSRGLMVVAMNVLPYARDGEGVGTLFRGSHSTLRTCVVTITSVVLGAGGMMLGRGALAGAICAAVAVAGGTMVLAFARRRIGGYTGDVLGAAGVVLETIGLLALTAHV